MKHVLSYSAAHTSSISNLKGTSISSQLDNKDITTNQNKRNTLSTYEIHSCVTPWKQSYSVRATSKTTNLTPLNATLPIAHVELNTTKKVTPCW